MALVFVDTWAWVALALRRDQFHEVVKRQHSEFRDAGWTYVTTDYVQSELITHLYRNLSADSAEIFIGAVAAAIDRGAYRIERITAQRFNDAWQLRRRYADKPTISFTDFTSFVVMRELGMQDVFTGDAHFEQVNLGFRLLSSK